MLPLTKTLHVLALGLWFGTAVFFTFVVGLTLFATFDELTRTEARPLWLPQPPELDRSPPSPRFPDPLRKEQGSRIAGAAVGPMFPWYFGIQAGCGILALATALTWRAAGAAHRVRLAVLVLALATVAAGWWLERVVEDLRVQRSAASDAVLWPVGGPPTSEQIAAADAARAAFGQWHTYSLLLNFGTVFLTGVATALAAHLPPARASGAPPPA